MKIMISAGEASGDMHAAAVAEEIKKIRPDADVFGMGGACMRAAGVRIIYDIKQLGIIGIVEVIKHIPFFIRLKSFLKETMKQEKPDVLVCVDYPGFHMKLAHTAHELGIPVVYYIAPTIWAWHKGRAKNIVRDVKKVISIFPFEADAYRKAGANVTYVGNPLVDTVKPTLSFDDALKYFHAHPKGKRVLLMPGSRLSEIKALLPIMLESCRALKKKGNFQFFLPRASTISQEDLDMILDRYPDVQVILTENKTYDLMQICTVCIASSGTATLETALMELPTILIYRLSSLTWFLAKRLVKVPYVGLPNLLLQREVTPELLQDEANVSNIVSILSEWLESSDKREKNKNDLKDVRRVLDTGGAVRRTAELIIETAGESYDKKQMAKL